MTFDTGVIAALLIGLAWVAVGVALWVILRRRKSQGATIGLFLVVVGALTIFGGVMLAVVPR